MLTRMISSEASRRVVLAESNTIGLMGRLTMQLLGAGLDA